METSRKHEGEWMQILNKPNTKQFWGGVRGKGVMGQTPGQCDWRGNGTPDLTMTTDQYMVCQGEWRVSFETRVHKTSKSFSKIGFTWNGPFNTAKQSKTANNSPSVSLHHDSFSSLSHCSEKHKKKEDPTCTCNQGPDVLRLGPSNPQKAQQLGAGGQPIWALNERNGRPVPVPLKTNLHPVRFHYAAGQHEWTESGLSAGPLRPGRLVLTWLTSLTACLHQIFFLFSFFLPFTLISALLYFPPSLCFSPHRPNSGW